MAKWGEIKYTNCTALEERLEAAQQDAKEAEAYAEELEAKLAKAIKGLEESQEEIDNYIWWEYPSDHPVHERYRQRDFAANPARIYLAELTGGSDE